MMTQDGRPQAEHAFDPVAEFYDQWFDSPVGAAADELETDLLYRLAGPLSGQRALDVGAGTGHFALHLAAKGSAVVAVDLSLSMLEVAHAKQAPIHLIRGDAATLPLQSARFDLVLSVTALEFIGQPQSAIAEMWRALRPGGRLVVGVLNALSPWAWARRREARKQETPFSHAHFYYPWEFLSYLRRLGPVEWSSSVFFGPDGQGLRWAWRLERVGRVLCKPLGALLVGKVVKWE
jgi:ubiquinone/menaquinone biosynthesis C-methylase UbiE